MNRRHGEELSTSNGDSSVPTPVADHWDCLVYRCFRPRRYLTVWCGHLWQAMGHVEGTRYQHDWDKSTPTFAEF